MSIVLMHLVCNALRVFLGIMVVALVGKKMLIFHSDLDLKSIQLNFLFGRSDLHLIFAFLCEEILNRCRI